MALILYRSSQVRWRPWINGSFLDSESTLLISLQRRCECRRIHESSTLSTEQIPFRNSFRLGAAYSRCSRSLCNVHAVAQQPSNQGASAWVATKNGMNVQQNLEYLGLWHATSAWASLLRTRLWARGGGIRGSVELDEKMKEFFCSSSLN